MAQGQRIYPIKIKILSTSAMAGVLGGRFHLKAGDWRRFATHQRVIREAPCLLDVEFVAVRRRHPPDLAPPDMRGKNGPLVGPFLARLCLLFE